MIAVEKMRIIHNSSNSVFNDYEESIMFDDDDPDFIPSGNLELNYKNGKLTLI